MATFSGLSLLLLVLAGLAICMTSAADPASPTQRPHPALNNSTPKGSSSSNKQTPNPPHSDQLQDATSSTTQNPTTQSNIPASTKEDKSQACKYTIEKTTYPEYAFVVKINSTSKQNYSIEYKDTSDNFTANITSEDESTILIPFKGLKPCHRYTIKVTPDCKSNHTEAFETQQLSESDITNRTVNSSGLCLQTKWNLSKCFQIEKNESCTSKKLFFENSNCSSVMVKVPPDMPIITYANQTPTMFNWAHKPPKCTKVSLYIICEGVGDTLPLDKELNEDKIKPFQIYNCTGEIVYDGVRIRSKNISVNITCDVQDPVKISESNSSIEASWNLTSSNCPGIKFSADVSVIPLNPQTPHTHECKHTNEKVVTCKISKLQPFQDYHLTFMANYSDKNVLRKNLHAHTTCGRPVFHQTPTHHVISNNVFRVKCDVSKWNGPDKNFRAVLCTGRDCKKIEERREKQCDFTFKDLSYSTEYTVTVYANSGGGGCEAVRSIKVFTKYNDKAVLGFLGFLIIVTSIALLFVLYKIYLLKRNKSRDEREMDDLLPQTTLLPVEPIAADSLVEAYKKKIADEGRLFMDEFQSIPRIFSNYTVKEAKKADNQPKNRYVDILPYDYNRVPLSNGGRHDYINASFIEGYKESNKYIAAQGPKEETVGDFWTMVWEQQSSIIVMVTRCEEGNKNKCAQYWPSVDRETEIFDDYVVKIKGEENCPDYVIRRLSLLNRREKTAERDITHIQFTSWPDHGVPGDPGLLLKLRRRVNSFKNFFSGPIVIHCSAGVGRTGTYIGIDAMIESLEAEGRMDIYGYVVKLRRQRCLMVQVEAQYILIHTALIEYNQFGETEIALSDFHSTVNTLKQKDATDPSLMEMEFQKVPKFKNWRSASIALSEENKKKNRSSVVPYDFNRVPIKLEEEHDERGCDADDEDEYSSDEEDEIPTKYINASYLDGYWCPRSLIAAQGPLADTVEDFLQMLLQQRVRHVVMLSDCAENGQEFCSQYWNDEKKEFGEMAVEVKETETFPTYIRRSLEIQHTKRKDSHTVQQYHFLKWAGNELPANPHDLIDMMKTIRQTGGYKTSRENRGTPIVFHCNDGSSRSGIACALWNILDSADTEKLVDVFQVVKGLRKERPGMITSLEQYQFLYAALEVAFPMQNGEVKKAAASPDTVQIVNEETALISAAAEDQEGAASSQSAQQQADAGASGASVANGDTGANKDTEANGASESSEQTEKPPSESATNGPTVTVEV